jgi:hypothetical protein
MKNNNCSTPKKWKLLFLVTAIQLSAFAQPVSWTAYYGAGDNTFPPPPTVNLKSIAYNPVNNNIYAYGQKFFNLPAQPSGNVYTRECGVVRYNNVTGGTPVSEIYDVHHDNTTLIPRSDEAGEMVIASDGSVYVTAKRYFDDTYLYDMVVIKYNSDLIEQWRIWFFSPGAADDAGIAIALDASGNVCVAGQMGDNGDFLIAKLSPSAVVLWQKVYNTSGTQDNVPTDIISDASDNVYVAGTTVSATNGNQYTLIKYNAAGVRQWTKYYNGVGGAIRDDQPNSIAVNSTTGDVYITGTSENGSSNTDIATVAFNSAGTKLWAKRINNAGDSRDRGYIVKIDPAQNIYVAGDVDKDATANISGDLIYRKYTPAGAVLNTKKYNGSGYNCEFGDMKLVNSNTVYMTGWCLGATIAPSNGTYSLMTVKYAAGIVQWGDFLTPGQFQTCGEGYYGFKIAVNQPTSEIAVGGRHWMWCPGAHPNEWMIRRYNPTLREGEEIAELTEVAGQQNIKVYPNPAANAVTIEVPSAEASVVEIVNVMGKIVYSEKLNGLETQIDLSKFSKGMYLARWNNGDHYDAKSFLIVK